MLLVFFLPNLTYRRQADGHGLVFLRRGMLEASQCREFFGPGL